MDYYIKFSNNLNKSLIRLQTKNEITEKNTLEVIKEQIENKFNLESKEYSILSNNGIELKSNYLFQNGQVFQICPKILGGKGGFGSLLRAFGKQITRSTDKGACRDLTGRRIRHVNNEAKLKEFLNNQTELKKQKEQEKKEKEERRKKKRDKIEAKHHLFVDPKYDEQKQKISQDLDEAINKGIENRKNINEETELKVDSPKCSKAIENVNIEKTTKQKVTERSNKFKDWMGVGDLEVSSSDDDGDKNEESVPSKKAKIN